MREPELCERDWAPYLEPPEDAEAKESVDLSGDGGPVVRDKG